MKAPKGAVERGGIGECHQHALPEALAPFRSRFDSSEQFEEVVGLWLASGRQAAVRKMLHTSDKGTKDIFGLFDEMDRSAQDSALLSTPASRSQD